TRGTMHTLTLTGLEDETSYHLKVVSKDAASNLATSSDAPFTTLDTTAPVITGVAVSAITGSGATLAWTTNEAASSEVEYGLTTRYGKRIAQETTAGTAQPGTVKGLADGTGYHFEVMWKDAADNQ